MIITQGFGDNQMIITQGYGASIIVVAGRFIKFVALNSIEYIRQIITARTG